MRRNGHNTEAMSPMIWVRAFALAGGAVVLLAGSNGGAAAQDVETAAVAPAPALAPAPAAATVFTVAPAPRPAFRIDPARELLITHLSVVEDPVRTTGLGAWTFGRLLTDMAGPSDAAALALDWLETWERDLSVNGFFVAARPSIRQTIIEPWLRRSGGQRLDLAQAPFRLLAIVNRLDLRRNPVYGAGHAGEGRFVFGALDTTGNPLPFTVIFEYELPARSLSDVKRWAQAWHALGSKPFGPDYNRALEAVTSAFAGPGRAPAKPNGSAINQVRTNEIALGSPWELREFRLAAGGARLAPVTTKQSPDASFIGTAELARFINANEALARAGRHVVPDAWLGGADPARLIWNAPGIRDPEARHGFALQTCSGCHFRETSTSFTHVSPRAAGQEAPLSGFLRGGTAPDPVTGTVRSFNDLARRAGDLRKVLEATWVDLAVEAPATATH